MEPGKSGEYSGPMQASARRTSLDHGSLKLLCPGYGGAADGEELV